MPQTRGQSLELHTKSSVHWLPTLDTAAVARQSKSADDIIRSATFPAAHAPSLDDSSRSAGGQWPCSLAALGTVGSRQACWHCYLLPGGRQATHHYLTLVIFYSRCSLTASPLQLQSFLRHNDVLIFTFCLHRTIEPQTWRLEWVDINCGLKIDLVFAPHTNLSRQNNNLLPQSTLWPHNRFAVCTKHQETVRECQLYRDIPV